MPTISRFFGIIISMYWDEHNPPHFHVRFGEYKCSVSIMNISVIVGELPKKQERLVLAWAEIHQKELLQNWELCQKDKQPMQIEPLR
ncbi:DUF4160 domain-containing protein [Allofrancisella guangzhouensis]|uniref:DUF4160 domain-containing protein n=1 Tax=Allofrancisella guangzhouensis TaxID=594679 RepID=UPI001906D32D|nr:DUF4160 domain-containing protein [Allofrancisella guangzhouensis]MBK2044853.1 DUF4160 domain-containing protein [Allofrancisella guangzhouensis]MBK2044999.1 DUF4160 domain-containing protein [Allofrancisella guangzhouensis]